MCVCVCVCENFHIKRKRNVDTFSWLFWNENKPKMISFKVVLCVLLFRDVMCIYDNKEENLVDFYMFENHQVSIMKWMYTFS